MKNKVSIIVPIYNVEKYLEKSINSIISQSYKNIEVILVDDGSSDKCPQICDDYAKKYNFIKVIHKNNGGLSDARNTGIKSSTGDYITFMDSDDYLSPHFLEIMVNAIVKYSATIVVSGLNDCYENDIVEEKIENIKNYVCTKEDIYKKMLMQDAGIDVSANAKLYKRDIFDHIQYPVGKLYEDIQVIDKIIETADVIVITTYVGYNYLQREGSIMYGKMSDDRLILLDKSLELLEFISANYPNIKSAAVRRYVYCNFHIMGRAVFDDGYLKICKIMRKNILRYKKNIFLTNNYCLKEKIATFILLFGIKFYKFFWQMYCKKRGKKVL